MHRLTITEFIITIALILGLAFGLNWALRSWLVNLNIGTSWRMERAGRIYK
jgi:hypothetical protein